ncbi:MAG: hypothetical protein K6G12_06800 [Lachnospiraceae bacterium]|nr:hypothetical protein [Lachnospiraceae bacterium]
MTVKEARKIVNSFADNDNPSGDDEFMFIEAMGFLIEEEHNPADMMYLGGYYYELKEFDKAIKYYEMAAAFDYDPAYEGLGYIWYYGRTGKRDYKKAFHYFSILKDKGDPVSTYKIADMYKNGYYVDKDEEKYEQIIEELYTKVRTMRNVFDPVPEVYTRLARIRVKYGQKDEAVELYLYAKDFLAQRIKYNAFFGNLNIMKWLIDDLYELIGFDKDYFDLYDMYYLLKKPCKIVFLYEGEWQKTEVVAEGNECNICFNGKWFRGRDEFYSQAVLNDHKLTSIYDELYGFEVK